MYYLFVNEHKINKIESEFIVFVSDSQWNNQISKYCQNKLWNDLFICVMAVWKYLFLRFYHFQSFLSFELSLFFHYFIRDIQHWCLSINVNLNMSVISRSLEKEYFILFFYNSINSIWPLFSQWTLENHSEHLYEIFQLRAVTKSTSLLIWFRYRKL